MPDIQQIDELKKEEKLIPVEQVLNDMYRDGHAHSPARDYYYQHYATREEQEMMQREDKTTNRYCAVFWICYISLIVVAITASHFR